MTFQTTCWSELAAASLDGDTRARAALDGLCQRYYEPVYRFVLRQGYDASEAKDLTQDFFLRFLDDRAWKRANRERGSFRGFILGALSHHLEDSQRYRRRLKRGGGIPALSLDENEGQGMPLPAIAPAEDLHFDQAWARKMLERALAQVQGGYEQDGKRGLYQVLRAYLPSSEIPPSYEESAARLGLSVANLKTNVHRLRQALRKALREEVAMTVSAPHEIDAELRYLLAALAKEEPGDVQTAKPPPPKSE